MVFPALHFVFQNSLSTLLSAVLVSVSINLVVYYFYIPMEVSVKLLMFMHFVHLVDVHFSLHFVCLCVCVDICLTFLTHLHCCDAQLIAVAHCLTCTVLLHRFPWARLCQGHARFVRQ